MYKLKIGSIPLPTVYIIERCEVDRCRELGVPYIIKPKHWDDDRLVKAVLWRTLNNKFPMIKWRDILGFHCPVDARELVVHSSSDARENLGVDTCGYSGPELEITDDYRMTAGGLDPDDEYNPEYCTETLDGYFGDLGHYVKVEELQKLKLLPVFLDDIATAIKTNLYNTAWMDGYNKKLGIPSGHYKGSSQAPNLIILDTSSSVPSGIAATMVSLIDTLRSQADADLIITTGRSVYFKAHEDLPDPDRLSHLVGGCNECRQFYDILRKHILGRHWGNVIVFGDNDAPNARRFEFDKDCWITDNELQSTRIDRIMAFHTYSERVPGYGLWAVDASPNAEVVFNTDWTNCMRRR